MTFAVIWKKGYKEQSQTLLSWLQLCEPLRCLPTCRFSAPMEYCGERPSTAGGTTNRNLTGAKLRHQTTHDSSSFLLGTIPDAQQALAPPRVLRARRYYFYSSW